MPFLFSPISKCYHLCVVLRNQLLAQLDVFVLCLLLSRASVDNLLPLVVLGLALCTCQS
jgi:hypothetical protein